MKKKYIQVSLSLRDKLKLFFFNIIPEEQLIVQQQSVQHQQISKEQKEVESQNINNSDDDFSVPFFDFDQNDKKSNF